MRSGVVETDAYTLGGASDVKAFKTVLDREQGFNSRGSLSTKGEMKVVRLTQRTMQSNYLSLPP